MHDYFMSQTCDCRLIVREQGRKAAMQEAESIALALGRFVMDPGRRLDVKAGSAQVSHLGVVYLSLNQLRTNRGYYP